MLLEVILLAAGALAGTATWARLAGARFRLSIVVPLLALLGTAAAAAAWSGRVRSQDRSTADLRAQIPSEGRPGGYVSSTACRACHPREHASWHVGYHRTMTQVATPETVDAPFTGTPLPVRDGALVPHRRGDEHWVTFEPSPAARARPDGPVRRDYRIGLLTGSHHMQMYWVGDHRGNRLEMFPYAFLIEDRRWVPARDTFLADPKIEWRFDVWNTQCLRCHVTAGQPRPAADGATMASRVAEIGIGCESCHGPAEEHVRRMGDPIRRYAAHLAKDPGDLAILNPRRLAPRASSEVCGQCHGVFAIRDYPAFLRDGFSHVPGEPLEATKPTVRPDLPGASAVLAATLKEEPDFVETRFWPDGDVRVTGREWTAMQRSPCHVRGQKTCLSCHSLHEGSRDDQLAAGAGGNEACLACHAELRPKLAAHSHHAPGSPGSLCYNCHMPHTSYGLLKAVRSHEVTSPDVAVTMATGRPNACNACHLDRSLAWTAERLATWYGKAVPPLDEEGRELSAAVMWAMTGDAAQRALIAWAMGWEPARAASGADWMTPYLVLALSDSYAAVRYIAQRSLRKAPGLADIDYDFAARPAELERDVQQVIARWARQRRPEVDPEGQRRLLLHQNGTLDTARVGALLARRNDRPMELRE
jgi:predicted CXXCH cytochrome family protein